MGGDDLTLEDNSAAAINVRLTYITGLLDGVRQDVRELQKSVNTQVEQLSHDLGAHRDWTSDKVQKLEVGMAQIRSEEDAFERMVPREEHSALMADKAVNDEWRKTHTKLHDDEAKTRQWIIGTIIGFVGVLAGFASVVAYLLVR